MMKLPNAGGARLSPAAATITPPIARPGQEITVTYRWQGGPTPIDLQTHAEFEWSGMIRGGKRELDFSEDFMPAIPSTRWAGVAEYSRKAKIPGSALPGIYVILASLRDPVIGLPVD